MDKDVGSVSIYFAGGPLLEFPLDSTLSDCIRLALMNTFRYHAETKWWQVWRHLRRWIFPPTFYYVDNKNMMCIKIGSLAGWHIRRPGEGVQANPFQRISPSLN